MIKMIFLVHRRPGLDRDEFRKYWGETHSEIAKKTPGVRKYIQLHAVPGPDGEDPPYDGFAEMWWDDAASMQAALETPEGKAALADTQSFLDLDRQQVFTVEQISVV